MSTTAKQVREWIARHGGARGTDGVVLALILEVIELRAKVEKLEAAQSQGLLAKLGRNRK